MLSGTVVRCMTKFGNRCREVFYNSGYMVRSCVNVHGLVIRVAKRVVLAVVHVQDYIENVRDL